MGMTAPSPALATGLAFLFFIAPVVFGAFVWAGYLAKQLLFGGSPIPSNHKRHDALEKAGWKSVGVREIREDLAFRARHMAPVPYSWEGYPRQNVPHAWLADVYHRSN